MTDFNPADGSSYFSYGLNIRSWIPLPDLHQTQSSPDVTIAAGRVSDSAFYSEFDPSKLILRPEIRLAVRAVKDSFCFDWDGLAKCTVTNGRDAVVELADGIEPEDFTPFVTGPILAVLLHQRERLVLHSSVVQIGDRAVLLVGHKGQGKSTLAAHFHAAGYKILSDDLAPIQFVHGKALVLPGHPQLRLFPDSAESLGLDPSDLETVNSGTTKRQLPLTGSFGTDAIPIAAVFSLEEGSDIVASELGYLDSFTELGRHTYLSLYVEATENSKLHFEHCNQLIDHAPIFRLLRPRTFDSTAAVIKRIVDIVANIQG
jgi:hypothetical protein